MNDLSEIEKAQRWKEKSGRDIFHKRNMFI